MQFASPSLLDQLNSPFGAFSVFCILGFVVVLKARADRAGAEKSQLAAEKALQEQQLVLAEVAESSELADNAPSKKERHDSKKKGSGKKKGSEKKKVSPKKVSPKSSKGKTYHGLDDAEV